MTSTSHIKTNQFQSIGGFFDPITQPSLKRLKLKRSNLVRSHFHNFGMGF